MNINFVCWIQSNNYSEYEKHTNYFSYFNKM